MRPFNRRDFLTASASATGLLALAALDNPLSPTKRTRKSRQEGRRQRQLRVAVVGVHGRGMSHVGGFARQEQLRRSPPSATATRPSSARR